MGDNVIYPTSVNKTIQAKEENTYVYNCNFYDVHSQSNGGAITHALTESQNAPFLTAVLMDIKEQFNLQVVIRLFLLYVVSNVIQVKMMAF